MFTGSLAAKHESNSLCPLFVRAAEGGFILIPSSTVGLVSTFLDPPSSLLTPVSVNTEKKIGLTNEAAA